MSPHTVPDAAPLEPTMVVGAGELAVADDPRVVLAAHALVGSVAVCIWDPLARVAGLLHFELPDSSVHRERARLQPEAFADTGIPLLFDAAFLQGLERERTIASLVGGAAAEPPFMIGARNLDAARRALAAEGVPVHAESTGGRLPWSVRLSAKTGRLRIRIGSEQAVCQ